MLKRSCHVFLTLVCVLPFLGLRTFDQDVARNSNDPCASIPIPGLTDEEAKKTLKRREKLNCDKIYNNRKRSFDLKIGNGNKRLLELGSGADLSSLTELGHLIALKEKTLCIYFKGNPEMTKKFRRCREREIDKWEKDIIRSITLNREAEQKYGGPLGQKNWPDPKTRKERTDLAEIILEAARKARELAEE